MENISWHDITRPGGFLERANERLLPAVAADDPQLRFRLPSETEWEYAARGGPAWCDGFAFSGSNDPDQVAWYAGQPAAVLRRAGTTRKPISMGFRAIAGAASNWRTMPEGRCSIRPAVSGCRPSRGVAAARAYLTRRFPALEGAPLLEARVCQCENSPDGYDIIDRVPGLGHCLGDRWWFRARLQGGTGPRRDDGPARPRGPARESSFPAGSVPEHPMMTGFVRADLIANSQSRGQPNPLPPPSRRP